jgi:hypothetical protein
VKHREETVVATRRYWVYYTWTTNATVSTAQDQHIFFSLDGDQDVSSTTRTLLRTRVQAEMRAAVQGNWLWPPGWPSPEAPHFSSAPFFYVYTFPSGPHGTSSDPSILTASNPDHAPAIGRTTVAPVIFTGMVAGTPAYVPRELMPDGPDPGWAVPFIMPPGSEDSQGQRRAVPGDSLRTRLQFWLPQWENQAGGDPPYIGHVNVQQLVQAVDGVA